MEIGLKLVGDTVRGEACDLGLVDVEEKWMFLRKQVMVNTSQILGFESMDFFILNMKLVTCIDL